MLSQRVLSLTPSPTLALDGRVKQLQETGVSIINLGLGEPDMATPANIASAAIKAISTGFTHYTATAGILPLRQAIARQLRTRNHLSYQPNEIVVGVGSKQLLYHALLTLCQKGDEVIIPTPTWSTYVEQVKLAQAKPVLIPLKPPFKLNSVDVSKAISDKTKVLLLNSPANPTGAVIDKTELKKIAKLAVRHGVYVISDEIYDQIRHGSRSVSIASFGTQIKKLTITINGFSKAYAMTGWRIGYAAGPGDAIAAMTALQSQTTSNTSSISQMAALAAATGPQTCVGEMVKTFRRRRALVLRLLAGIPKLDVIPPEGAFYIWVSIKKLLNLKYPTSAAWCSALLNNAQVAVVPGEAFLAPGYFRLSLTATTTQLTQAVNKITGFIDSYA